MNSLADSSTASDDIARPPRMTIHPRFHRSTIEDMRSHDRRLPMIPPSHAEMINEKALEAVAEYPAGWKVSECLYLVGFLIAHCLDIQRIVLLFQHRPHRQNPGHPHPMRRNHHPHPVRVVSSLTHEPTGPPMTDSSPIEVVGNLSYWRQADSVLLSVRRVCAD